MVSWGDCLWKLLIPKTSPFYLEGGQSIYAARRGYAYVTKLPS